MKNGATLALAITLGAAGVFTYLYLTRHPQSVPAAEAVEPTSVVPDEASSTGGGESGARAGDHRIAAALPDKPATFAPAEKTAPLPDTALGSALGQETRLARMRALVELASSADAGTLRGLVAEANRLGPADRRDSLEILLLRWFELDPQSAPRQLVDTAIGKPAGIERTDEVTSIARAWAQIAPGEAFEYAARIRDAGLRAEYESAVLAAWGERDPAAALGSVIAMPQGWRKDQLLRQAASDLVRQDPERAIALAMKAPRLDSRPLLTHIVQQWAAHDPRAAGRWLAGNMARANRSVAMQIASRYGAIDPEEAIAWGLRVDRTGNRGVVGMALAGYAESNPQEALRLAMGIESEQHRGGAITAVLSAIARTDPQLAMANLDKAQGARWRGQAAGVIAQQLARSDPRAALEWLGKQPDDDMWRYNSFASLASGLADNDLETAVSLAEHVPPDMRAHWVANIVGYYAAQEPDAALRWLRSFQDDPSYQQILAQAAPQLSMVDAQAAFELAAAMPDARQRDQAMVNMMSRGSMRSPETAVRWLDRIKDDQMRARAAQNILWQWSQSDPEAARKWTSNLPVGALRDSALSALVGAGASGRAISADEVSTMIGQIGSPDVRAEAVYAAAMRLARSDIEGARTLLRRHPLDPSRREMLARQLSEHLGITL
jgi:hypothetical protein